VAAPAKPSDGGGIVTEKTVGPTPVQRLVDALREFNHARMVANANIEEAWVANCRDRQEEIQRG
jgi:hypothetical protein